MTTRLSTGARNAMAGATGFATTFDRGVIEIRSGTQPASADNAVSGVLLGLVTLSSGAFTPGSSTNGLTWGSPSGGTVAKSGTWSFVGIANGVAGWYRLRGNAADDGLLSTTLPRMDGSVAAAGGDLQLSTTTITIGAPVTIDSFTFTIPAN